MIGNGDRGALASWTYADVRWQVHVICDKSSPICLVSSCAGRMKIGGCPPGQCSYHEIMIENLDSRWDARYHLERFSLQRCMMSKKVKLEDSFFLELPEEEDKCSLATQCLCDADLAKQHGFISILNAIRRVPCAPGSSTTKPNMAGFDEYRRSSIVLSPHLRWKL